jgi:hypothetical protein
MLQHFGVSDVMLTSHIFLLANTKGDGALDVRDLIGRIIFWLRGDLGYKFALYFEVFSSFNKGAFVNNEHVAQPIQTALKIYKEIFFLAKTACDNMNTNLNGKISFDEFR